MPRNRNESEAIEGNLMQAVFPSHVPSIAYYKKTQILALSRGKIVRVPGDTGHGGNPGAGLKQSVKQVSYVCNF